MLNTVRNSAVFLVRLHMNLKRNISCVRTKSNVRTIMKIKFKDFRSSQPFSQVSELKKDLPKKWQFQERRL